MKTIIFIPARYASSRYPAKPLATLRQPDGTEKTLIQMSWETACQVDGVDAVYVATDDDRIASAARAFGAEVVMTDEACENGTARCADALEKSGLDADLIINFQGDAPLTPPWFLEALIDAMLADPTVDMSTPVLRCDGEMLSGLLEDRRAGRVGGTTAVFGARRQALYFSKEVIPFAEGEYADTDPTPVFHHVGLWEIEGRNRLGSGASVAFIRRAFVFGFLRTYFHSTHWIFHAVISTVGV